MPLFISVVALYSLQLLTCVYWEQNTLSCKAPHVSEGWACVFYLWHVCASVSSRLPLSVECSILGEPSDLLSGADNPIPTRVQLRESPQEWKVHVSKCTHTLSNTGCKCNYQSIIESPGSSWSDSSNKWVDDQQKFCTFGWNKRRRLKMTQWINFF